ncbi:T9SS type A sorting domain-containing protein [Chryseolinea lacunae]|uniref:T9SS type A sorting domain-containing protein n=1 Tax=Chryseolinea lacunae TaxID=2801331 RepID=A0ABS1KUE7_9BACT|nr:T9SS type A sorting domain-containing protein [Chryseolinea lacunae]MBL0742327.1 T9SS type A sorting domain-containing protein [Chryseolinea lacunae]
MKKNLVLGILAVLLQSVAFGQTSTTGSGNWSDATLWTSGVPAGGTTNATINNALILDIGSLTISSGDYIFNASATDMPGGSQLGVSVGNGGVWEVAAGTVTLEGNMNLNNFSTLTVRAGATLITGSVAMGNNVTVLVEAGGTWIINGDLNSSNQAGTFTIGGLVSISNNFQTSGTAEIIGTGDITTGGSMLTNGSSEIFDSTGDCNTGPCSGRNLCGFTNVITTASQVKCSSAVGVIVLNATTSAASPTYLWESSTASQTSGFASATPVNNASSYTVAATPAQTIWYRRKVTASGCTGTSIPVKITVVPSAGGWIGAGADNNWNTTANWCSGVPTATTDVTIPSGVPRMPTVNITTAVARDLVVNPGATITLSSGNTLSISGNFTNNGTLTANSTSTAVFTGTAAQNLGGSSFSTFDRLTINKTSGTLTLNGSFATVSSILTMTAGNVNLNGNPLTLGASGSPGTLTYTAGWLYGGSFTRYFNGGSNITIGNAAGLFPMGTAADTRPLYVGANGINPNGYIRVSHTGATTTNNVSFNDTDAQAIVRRQNSFWAVSSNLSSGTYSLRAGGTGFGTISTVAHLRLVLSGSVVASPAPANSGTPASPLVERISLSGANLTNNFYIGSINGTLSPLPVKLISFDAQSVAEGIQLTWKTSSEDNFHYYQLERAGTDLKFVAIARIEGAGGHAITKSYDYLDRTPLSGKNYYRLKMVDVDEVFEYSPVVTANGTSLSGVSVYPNPIKNNSVTVALNDTMDTPVQLQLLDGTGTLVLRASLDENVNVLQLPDSIRPGVYFLQVSSGYVRQIIKVVIQ